MSGTTRRRTEPVDAIWLSMDRASNRMVIVTLMFLATPPDWDEVVRLFRARVLDRYPVFTQRPVPGALGVGLPWCQDDPAFDLDRHVRRLTLAAPGDDDALQSHVEATCTCRSTASTPCGRCSSSTGTATVRWCSPGSTTRWRTASRWCAC